MTYTRSSTLHKYKRYHLTFHVYSYLLPRTIKINNVSPSNDKGRFKMYCVASSKFWRLILPYSWTRKYKFPPTTIRTLFDENISNQFYISLCVKIFNSMFCF